MASPHILVVDDEPHVALVIQAASPKWGCDVTTVRSLAECRSVLADQEFDLIMLDVQLPDGSGLDFLAELRQEKATEKLPVLVLTGAGYDTVLTRAETLGAQCVTKPFSPSKLWRIASDILNLDPEDQ